MHDISKYIDILINIAIWLWVVFFYEYTPTFYMFSQIDQPQNLFCFSCEKEVMQIHLKEVLYRYT